MSGLNGNLMKRIKMCPSAVHVPLYIIAAMEPNGGIGKEGRLPWPFLSRDMQHFKQLTTNKKGFHFKNAVVMGRKTWDSLPAKSKPLPERINFIFSKTLSSEVMTQPNVHVIRSIEEIFSIIADQYENKVEEVFVIGGYQIYKDVMETGLADFIFLTRIGKKFECDVFIPDIPEDLYEIISISSTAVESDIPFDFVLYSRKKFKENVSDFAIRGNDWRAASLQDCIENEIAVLEKMNSPKFQHDNLLLSHPSIVYRKHEEFQYLDCVMEIIQRANKQHDRTGVGTLSLFGKHMRFSLRESFPLLTTKRVYWKGVVEELLWFIKGSTNSNILSEKGVKIWEKNGSREYLDSIGLNHREAGDLGPIYGFQWRHFGAEYVDMHTDYTGKGIDQLQDCIHRIKTNPSDRRIILTAWNPSALKDMALPPCHVLCQFYVANGELSCLLFQRSCDMGLGVPFNIASYSLLTCVLAQVCGLKRGDFVYCLGNVHIYLNHIEALKTQLQRVPRPFPWLKIQADIMDIDQFQSQHFKLNCYYPYDRITMEMAV